MNKYAFTPEEIEYNKAMYSDDSYGIYRFNLHEKEVINAIIDYHNRYPNSTYISLWSDIDFPNSNVIFDTGSVYITVYYHMRDMEAVKDIEEDSILSQYWVDTDCYDMDDNALKNIKEKTEDSIRIIEDLLYMDQEFINKVMRE